MRLICPNCDAQYEVDPTLVPANGRDVQCSNCGKTWFQPPPQAGDLDESADADDAAADAEAGEEDVAGQDTTDDLELEADEDLETERWDGPEEQDEPEDSDETEGGEPDEPESVPERKPTWSTRTDMPREPRSSGSRSREETGPDEDIEPEEESSEPEAEAESERATPSFGRRYGDTSDSTNDTDGDEEHTESERGPDQAPRSFGTGDREASDTSVKDEPDGEGSEPEPGPDMAKEAEVAVETASDDTDASESEEAEEPSDEPEPVAEPRRAPMTRPGPDGREVSQDGLSDEAAEFFAKGVRRNQEEEDEAWKSGPRPDTETPWGSVQQTFSGFTPGTRLTEDQDEAKADDEQARPAEQTSRPVSRSASRPLSHSSPERSSTRPASRQTSTPVSRSSSRPVSTPLTPTASRPASRLQGPEAEENDEPQAESRPRSAPRPQVDPSVLGILRAEAEREIAARRADEAVGRVPPVDEEDPAAVSSPPSTRPLSTGSDPEDARRRALLPDIDDINATLTASSDRPDLDLPTSPAEEEIRRERTGFTIGFSVILAVCAILIGGYVFAPTIAENMPGLEPFLAGYLDWANGMRIALDTLLQKTVDALSGS